MKKKTIKLFQKIAKSALRPLPNLSVSDWADNYRMLSSESSSEPGRWRTDRAPYQREIMNAFTDNGIWKVVVMSCSQIGKALDINTPIATPDGWKTMAELQPGDRVFDEQGKQCRIMWKSAIMENHDCYEITFSDGNTIIADAGHKWYVEPYNAKPCVKITREIAENYKCGKRNVYAIPVAGALETPDRELLIHPYLLGVWLGDGNSYSAQITTHEQDIEIAGYIKKYGHNVVIRDKYKDKPIKNIQIDPLVIGPICRRGHDTRITGLTKRGYCAECHRQITLHNQKGYPVDPVINAPVTLRSKLAKLNLLGNKHIPRPYLRASFEQRLNLLQGLMDSDGTINKNGRCEITLKSKILIDNVSELLHSLGIKHTVKSKTAVCTNSPTKASMQVWRISFLVYKDKPVFKLQRHIERQKSREGCRTTETERRRIINVQQVASRPVCCIAVDSPNHLYLAGKAMIPTHNSDIMNNVIGRYAHLAPAPMMMIQPTIELAQDYSKSRISPMIRDTKVLSGIFREAKSRDGGNTILSKLFPGGRLIMGGANSPAGLASRPIKILLADEVDRFPDSAGTEGDPVDLAVKRMTTFWDKCMGLFSTPTISGESRIEEEYQEGTQEEWQHECPNCKEYHLLTHRQMFTDYETVTDKKSKKHVTVNVVKWRCPDCGYSFTQEQMRRAPQKYVAQNASALNKGVRSFFVNCWASPWLSWETPMQEWLEAEGDPEREKVVVNTRFGEAYERKGAFDGTDQFLQRREPYDAELPDGVLILTAAVDVQDNRLEYEICGWGKDEECWGIKKGIILGAPDTPEVWAQLDEQLDREYRFKNGMALIVPRTFIDSGGHYTKEVYDYCQRRIARQRFAIKGASTPGVPIIYKYTKGTATGNRTIPLVLIGTDSGKQYIMDRLAIDVPGPKYFHYPLDKKENEAINEILWNRGYDDIYFRGLIAEQRVARKKNGRIVWQWENIAKDKRNEPLDLRVYNLACLHSLNVNWELLDCLINNGDYEKNNKRIPKNDKKVQKKDGKRSFGCIKRGLRGDF